MAKRTIEVFDCDKCDRTDLGKQVHVFVNQNGVALDLCSDCVKTRAAVIIRLLTVDQRYEVLGSIVMLSPHTAEAVIDQALAKLDANNYEMWRWESRK